MRRGNTVAVSALLLGSLVASGLLRARLGRERDDLKLTHAVTKEAAGAAGFREAFAGPQVALTSVALGIFRPLAINFLWLRYLELQERGEFLELPALAEAITALEPRLPQVWEFQAWNLGYNISAAYPRRDRFRWVLRAISLLRDDALRFNPESPRLYAELAYIFHHKIGLDFDEAGRDYRSRLAATFDVPAGSAAEASLLAEWKLDRDLSRRLAARLGVARLDFRAAGAHALYWAGRGLEVAGAGADPYDIRRLQILVLLSIRDLFEGGYPLRAGSKRSYAFVPHLECFDAAARELKRWVDEQAKDDEAGRREVLSAFFREALTYHFLFGRLEAARALLESSRDLLGANGKSLESLAMEGFLQADPNQVAAGDLLRALESCLESSLLLALAPEDPTRASLAEGFLSLARLLHGALRGRVTAAPPAGEKVGEFEEYLAAARLRRFEGKGKSEPGQLPWHLELLDPRQEAED